MNKVAYILGVKLAMRDAGLVNDDPVEELVNVLKNDDTVLPQQDPTVEAEEPIGAPKDDHRTFSGSRVGNIDSDLSYGTGLDIRGPSDTSI